MTVFYRITAIISNRQRIKEAKQSFLFSKFIFCFIPKLYPLPCFCSSEFSFQAGCLWDLWGWPRVRLQGASRLLVSVCNLRGAKDLSTSLVVRAGTHTVIFNVCRAIVFPWGSWRHLSSLGFLPQTTIQAPLSKWQLAVAGASALCFSHDYCFTLVSSTLKVVCYFFFFFLPRLLPAHPSAARKYFRPLVPCWSSGLCRYCAIHYSGYSTIFSLPLSSFSIFCFSLSFCFKALQLCFAGQVTFQEELK